MAVPNSCGFCGSRSDCVLLTCGCPACLQLARLSGLLGNGAAPDAKRNCYADKRSRVR